MSRASEYARNVSDLYAQQGEAYGRAAANKSAIWGGAVANIGDFAANAVQAYSHAKQDKRLKDLFERASQEYQAGQSGIVSEESGRRIADAIAREKAAGTYQGPEPFSTRGALPQPINAPAGGTTLPQPINAPTGGTAFTGPQRPPRQSPMPTLGELINVVGPERAIKIADGLKGLQAIASPQVPFEKKMSGLRDTMLGLNALSPEMRKEFYPHARQVVLGAGLGINPADVPEQFDENWFQSIVNYGKDTQPATQQVDWVDTIENGKHVKKAVPRVAGTAVEVPPPELTPDQKADNERAAEQFKLQQQREAREAENAAADNARADRQLGLSQGQLDLARQREAREAEQAKSSPASQAEITAAGYAGRMEDAEKVLKDVESSITGMRVLSYAAQSRMPAAAQSKEFQRYDQAGRNFINAVLRRESGAAVSQSEFDNARRQYLPQPGDDPETLKQKAQNRKRALDTLKQAGGKAYQASVPMVPAPKKVGRFIVEAEP